jgi:uncharacterized protein with FMN-binding domain
VKRALFVSAGTVAGLVASLSYTPGIQAAAGTHAAKGGTPAKAVKADKPSAERAGNQDRGSGKATKQDTKKDGGSAQQQTNGGGGQQTTTRSGGGSGGGSAQASTKPGSSGSTTQPKPSSKPTQSSKPKPSPKPSPEPKPSTYTGAVVSTPFGPVQVAITVLSGKITDATAVQYPHADPQSVTIARDALPKLRSETLAAQSASIAAVSGATYTSNGWISSLQSALAKAGL